MNKLCVIVSQSIKGNTNALGQQVVVGASSVAGVAAEHLIINEDGVFPANGWDLLEEAEGVMFGCPTLTGGPSWQFKKFADATMLEVYPKSLWKDKIAAGFTISPSMSADRGSTLNFLFSLAMHHSMIWVGSGLKHAVAGLENGNADPNDISYSGPFMGLMAQAPESAAQLTQQDLRTARHFGHRFAGIVLNYEKPFS